MKSNINIQQLIINLFKQRLELDLRISSQLFGIYLFGSSARNQSLSKHSDIDLLIVSKTPTPSIEMFTTISSVLNIAQEQISNKIEVSFVTLEEIPLLVSPALSYPWIIDIVHIWGESPTTFKQIVTSNVSSEEIQRSLVRRGRFALYMCRQQLAQIASHMNITNIEDISRKITKQIIWEWRTRLLLEDTNSLHMNINELIENFKIKNSDNLEIFVKIEKIIVNAESTHNVDDLTHLYEFLENLVRSNTVMYCSKFNRSLQRIITLDPF